MFGVASQRYILFCPCLLLWGRGGGRAAQRGQTHARVWLGIERVARIGVELSQSRGEVARQGRQ